MCLDNTHATDGQLILQSSKEGDKPFLIILQMKYTGTRKTLEAPEVKDFCDMCLSVAPTYSSYQIIPVFITNRPMSEGKFIHNDVIIIDQIIQSKYQNVWNMMKI